MLIASQAKAELYGREIPVLPGFQSVVKRGIESTLTPDNRELASRIEMTGLDEESERASMLFDPQTSGGLLIGVSPDSAAKVVRFLGDHGFGESAVIGTVTETACSPALKIRL